MYTDIVLAFINLYYNDIKTVCTVIVGLLDFNLKQKVPSLFDEILLLHIILERKKYYIDMKTICTVIVGLCDFNLKQKVPTLLNNIFFIFIAHNSRNTYLNYSSV